MKTFKQIQLDILLKRTNKFLKLYRCGETLQEIGDTEDITRERVRQILSLSPIYKVLRKKRIESYCRVISCLMCQEKVTYPIKKKWWHNGKCRKFCSRKCYGKAAQKKSDLRHSKPRRCVGCRKVKPPGGFYPRYGAREGLRYPYCKKCQCKATNSWRKRNPERAREIQRRASKKYLLKLKSSCA